MSIFGKIGGIVSGVVGGFVSGGPVGAIAGGVKGVVGGGQKQFPASVPGITFDPRIITDTIAKILPQGRCNPPAVMRNGICQTPTPGVVGFGQRVIPGGATGFEVAPANCSDFGEAVNGQFGVALVPATCQQTTHRCPSGAVLGRDGLCYNKSQISNKERLWPQGRRPLLTGGEMRAISTAASAAKKLQRKQKQLISMGMLPSASRGRRVPAGHKAKLSH